MTRTLLGFILNTVLFCWAAAANEPTYPDQRVAMRDGATLSTDVWLPEEDGPSPAILLRTPYVKSAALYERYKLSAYVSSGYAVVLQDTRGTGASEGQFDFYFPEGEDGFDTIEWIAAQPWCSGKVGTDGGSYMGTVQWLTARERPPHLVCIAPTAPSGDLFGELPYVGGAFHMGWALTWIHGVTGGQEEAKIDWNAAYAHRPLLTADEILGRELPFYRDALRHPVMDGYWRRIHFDATSFAAIDVPVFTVTGWFDGDQAGALFYWRGQNAAGDSGVERRLIIGPWNHRQTYLGGAETLGAFEFTNAGIIGIQQERLRFFDRHLKGAAPPRSPEKPVRVFIMGANEWREYRQYPPTASHGVPLYLRDGARLAWEPPANETPDAYDYDPKDPAPFEGGAIDYRDIEARGDVLVYTSPVLQKPLEILGPVRAILHASTDAPDTDFVVRLLDVYPDGRAINLIPAGGVIRARYRNGYDREELLTSKQSQAYNIALYDLGIRFQPGHRIRVEVTSSAYPYINPNQNTGNPVATDTEWRTAHQEIRHDTQRPSHVLLPILGSLGEVF